MTFFNWAEKVSINLGYFLKRINTKTFQKSPNMATLVSWQEWSEKDNVWSHRRGKVAQNRKRERILSQIWQWRVSMWVIPSMCVAYPFGTERNAHECLHLKTNHCQTTNQPVWPDLAIIRSFGQFWRSL